MEPCSIATAAGGLSWIFWTAVGGTLGNWSDRQFCAVVVDLKERLTGLSGLPANHDVARAVRVAQLQALHRSIQDFADLQVPVIGRVLLRGDADAFIAEARHYCTQSITRVHDNDASFDPKSTLVRVLLIDGDLAVAEPLSRDAARIYEQALGPDHPALAASFINLATVLQRQGRSGEAVPLVERAVTIHEAALGPIHSTVASTLLRLASLIEDMGDYVRARPLVERALDINVRTLGSDHPISATVRGHLEQFTAAAS